MEKTDLIRAAHDTKKKAVIYASKDYAQFMGAIAFTLYISAAIPERYAAWCICSGNDRANRETYAEYADSVACPTPCIFKGGLCLLHSRLFFSMAFPLLTNDAYVYGIKNAEVNPIGTATNILASLNMDNVASIEVV
jgi:hypothetical protein